MHTLVRFLVLFKSFLHRFDCIMSLFAAASNGELKEVQELIETGKIDVDVATQPGGKTALHFACDKGHLDVIMYLVSIITSSIHFSNSSSHTILSAFFT